MLAKKSHSQNITAKSAITLSAQRLSSSYFSPKEPDRTKSNACNNTEGENLETGMYTTTCENSSSGLVKDPFL